ncbi:MAG: hypothetical protein HY820_08350 [Acidobacteria bacterium]|nr:hypothetical protein [Acidobacteriota bacterium]
MRLLSLLMLGLLSAASVFAQDAPAPTKVSMWIWSDKYVYQPGQQLTLKFTVKTNGDDRPYTLFVYRQNNQTGKKTFLPAGTEAPVDVLGNGLTQGFQAVPLVDTVKGTLVGDGGLLPAITIPDEEFGMHTLVVQVRDASGSQVLKSAYMKIGVVRVSTVISGEITSDRILTNDTAWEIRGIVYVKNNATLMVEPGTFILGQPGSTPASAIIVTRDGKINASGTKSRPIIMTSSQPFGQRARGDWGGLVMLGKAPINVAASVNGGICPADGCKNPPGTFYVEGLVGNPDSLYGGNDPNHSCGTLKYVRVEYAGTILSPNNELNSFTWGGCGKGTVAEHLQATYGKDDSFEWFGGNMDAKWLVGGLGADDFIDYQLGWTGRVQFGLMYQSPDAPGNRGLEGDNSEYDQGAVPYSSPTIFNTTFIGSGNPGFDESNSPGLFLRRGARASLNNMVVSNYYSPCLDLNDANTQAQGDQGNVKMNGILCWKNNIGSSGADTLEGNFSTSATSVYSLAYAQGQKGNGAGKNVFAADHRIKRPAEYSDPDFRALFNSPVFRVGWVQPPDDGFFDQSARFLGGIGEEDWTEEWTSWLVESDIQ